MALLSTVPIWSVLVYSCAAYLIFSFVRAVRYFCFHPLSSIPGPWLRAAFYFPSYWEIWTGEIAYNWHELHERYGPVVRVSPTCVSTINADAWRDIYGSPAKKSIPKDPDVYFRSPGATPDLVNADDATHTRMRRLLNHAFSDQALRGQEGFINSYINLLIEKLHKKAASGSSVDLMRWLNFTTFDIIGDLCFGESFDSLEKEDYNVWVANIFKGFRTGRMFRIFRGYPILGVPIFTLLKMFPQLKKGIQEHKQYTVVKTGRRLDSRTDRKDFMSYILKHNDEKGMTKGEITETSGLIIIAGSETSATLLSGAFFYLLKNPSWYNKLQQEIVDTFHDKSEMTFASLSQLKILNAVIQETFRMYPPVPTMLPRLTSEAGAMVSGKFIPPNTTIGIAQWPAYRSSKNFTDPDVFAPERFLGDSKYKDDARSILQPFSVGQRNCIGQNIAQAEIRAILARLVWNFDMELEDQSANWNRQKVYILWDKSPLMVKLRRRGS